jgi:hypothetical protein
VPQKETGRPALFSLTKTGGPAAAGHFIVGMHVHLEMSKSLVSRRKKNPITTVIRETMIGYQSP